MKTLFSLSLSLLACIYLLWLQKLLILAIELKIFWNWKCHWIYNIKIYFICCFAIYFFGLVCVYLSIEILTIMLEYNLCYSVCTRFTFRIIRINCEYTQIQEKNPAEWNYSCAMVKMVFFVNVYIRVFNTYFYFLFFCFQ